MHRSGLNLQIDTFEDLLVLFFKFYLQTFDIQHFNLVLCLLLPGHWPRGSGGATQGGGECVKQIGAGAFKPFGIRQTGVVFQIAQQAGYIGKRDR